MPSSLEATFISKVMQAKCVGEATESGVTADFFSESNGEVWAWMVRYWREQAVPPTSRAFKAEFPDFTLYDTTEEDFEYLLEEVRSAHREKLLTIGIAKVMKVLDRDNLEALQEMTALVETVHGVVGRGRSRDIDIIERWQERVDRYEHLRTNPGAMGIPSGFRGLDALISGWRPQQFIILVGEAKKGKSIIELIMAQTAHAHGVPPMFMSFEMSVEEQEARYDALLAGVPYNSILTGKLTKAEIERIAKQGRLRKNMHPFIISEDTHSTTTVSAISSKLQRYRPGILFVDGIYLLDDESGAPKGTAQALTNVSRAFKRMAQRFDIPVVATTQVLPWKIGNRKTRVITAESIGYTSSFVQDADVVIGVESDPDIADQAILRIVEARAAARGEVHIHWDWANMDFSEVTEEGGSDDDHWY